MCLAIPGLVLSVEGDDPVTRAAKVSFEGILKDVNLAFVPDAHPGDYVLVHVGFAISKLSEEHAREVFEVLEKMGELADLKAAERPAPGSA